jgi:hypothetical protein
MRGPEVSLLASRAGSIRGAVGHILDIVNQAREKIEIGGCGRDIRRPGSLFFPLSLILAPTRPARRYRPARRRHCVARCALTFQFVLNVGAEVASFDSQQPFLRSRLREVGDSRHAAHDSRGCVIRDAEH